MFVGVLKTYAAGGHPVALAPMPAPAPALGPFTGFAFVWLIMKAFSSGCAAMTGVEAVSNGVMAFGEPRAKKAQWTLTVIIMILIVLLYGTSWIAKHYQIMAMEPNDPNYQSLLSLLVKAVFGRGWFLTRDHGQCLPGSGAEREYRLC